MPGLRKLLSSIKLGSEKPGEAELIEGQTTLQRSSAKLQKRNRSSINVPGLPHGSNGANEAPKTSQHFTRGCSLRPSRQNSFELGRSLKEFDSELRAMNSMRTSRNLFDLHKISETRSSICDGSLISKLGLNVNTADRSNDEQTLATMSSDETHEYVDAATSQDSWATDSVSNATANIEDHVARSSGSTAELEKAVISDPYHPPAIELSVIRTLDWITMSHEQAREKGTYLDLDDSEIDPHSPAGSAVESSDGHARHKGSYLDLDDSEVDPLIPVDSAGESSNGHAAQLYAGKGKGRQRSDLENDDLAAELKIAETIEQMRWAHTHEQRRLEEQDRIEALEIQEQLWKEQIEEERLAAQKPRARECAVCGDSKDPLDFPAKTPTAECEHPVSTCSECLQSWMASECEAKGFGGDITCSDCPAILEYSDVQRAASPETFTAYDKGAMRSALGNLDDFAWCLAPNCGSGQLNVGSNNFMECASCKYKMCLKHKVPWHSNETCAQYDYRTSGQKARDEETRTEAMLDSMSKKCPGKKCGWRIQKIDGCDHMTCKRCRHEFCWQCLAAQSEIKRIGNTAHDISCRFHSWNLNRSWPFNVH